jgi:ubiquinone/menaquinone biosynthesis C-methylase UbiE
VSHPFDPAHADRLENPDRLVELPPASIARLLALEGATTLIDFGAGTGMYTLPLADAFPQGTVIAVDEQEALLERLRAKLAEHPPAGHVEVVLSSGGRVPLPDGAGDRLLMLNVVHHIAGDEAALAEVLRLLRPGGLLLSVEFAQMDRPVGPPNDHVLSFAELRSVLADLGLQELATYRPGEVGRYHVAVLTVKPEA